MDTPTQDVPGYYVWQPEGSRIAVHFKLDVIDRMGAEVMRGFGLVPKRGAEVGGILLGAIQRTEPVVLRIDDFEPVACSYKRGPSFLLSEEDTEEFRKAWQQTHSTGRPPYAVGYYRSHTRDAAGLGADDLEILERYFSDPDQVALIVRPFATKPSQASFYVRHDGQFEQDAEFPFRRYNLTGEEAPRRRPMEERRPRSTAPMGRTAGRVVLPEVPEADLFKSFVEAPKRSRFKFRWVWIPVAIIFTLAGVFLGLQVARTMSPAENIAKESDYRLALEVTRTEDNLTVRWSREAPVVRAAARGTLEIEDGGFSKSVDLDYANLESGSIIYRNSSDTVRFRLVVFLSATLTITESLEWNR